MPLAFTPTSAALFPPTIAEFHWEFVRLLNGENIGWLMNGLTVSTSAFLPTIADVNWDFVGQQR